MVIYICYKCCYMFFNLFGRKKEAAIHFTNLVYISQQAKQNAVIEFASQHVELIFITWFEDTTHQFKQLFKQHGLDENNIEEARYYTAAKYPDKQIIFLEHYPLRDKEERLVQNSTQQNFTIYNALTEPLFTYFGEERIIALMQKMGYQENEPVQSKMINLSLQNAQKKIAKRLALEQPANSQEEWMRKNVGEGKNKE
jgi:hypothetical protein